MASVDNRIVEMKFDNAAFERKVATTITSLDKLQKSLDLADATKGFSDIDAAAKNVKFGGISAGVEGLTAKFSALQVVGITVLSNITSKAVDSGIALGKSLSLDQIISGFQEYETNMKSIQTILANTKAQGTDLDDVNGALDELNAYADLTIYNFAEMTRNIGTFTAAGVDLDTSVQSIKGIANLAAISGSSSAQAGTAMYQLSQAISTGALKLMDWNSVVNAGMGGRVFQEALFTTGKAMGTIVGVPIDQTFDEWTDAGNTFRDSLQDGWITADVLTTTLQGIAGEMDAASLAAVGYTEAQVEAILELGETGVEAATKVRTLTALVDTAREAVGSGWSASFRIILGDFEEATVLFSDISERFGNMVGASADARNAILEGWANNGGRQALIDGIYNSAEALFSLLNPIKDAFQQVFPPITSARLIELSETFRDFTDSLILNRFAMSDLRDISAGVFSALEIVFTVVKEAGGLFKDLFDELTGNLDQQSLILGLIGIADSIGDLNEKLVEGGGIAAAFDAIRDAILAFVNDPIGSLLYIKDLISEVFTVITTGSEDLGNLPSGLVDFLNDIRETIIGLPDLAKEFFTVITTGYEDLGVLPSGVVDFLNDVRDGFFAFADGVPLVERLGQRFQNLSDNVEKFKELIQPLTDVVNTVFGYISNWFSELADKMAAAADPGDFSKVLDAVNLGLVAGIGGLLTALVGGIDLDFGGILEGLTETLEGFGDVLSAMAADIKSNALLKIAAAVGILAAAAVVLATVDSASLTKAMTAIAVGLSQLMIGFLAVTKIGGPKGATSFVIAATGLVALSTAILILAGAVKLLSTMSWEELAKGLSVITVLLAELAIAVQFFSANSAGMVRAGIGLTLVGVSLNLLAASMKIFATMSWEEIAKGLAAVSGGLVGIAAGLQLMPSNMVAKGAGLILVATSLNILAGAVAIFAAMSWESIGKGLAGIAGGLIGIGIAMQLMPATLPVIGAGLLLVSGSILLIAEAMRQISDLTWEEIAKGLAGMAGSLLILGIAATAMGNPMVLVGAVAIGILSVALLALASAISTIGTLSLTELITGLAGIAAVFGILGVATLLLTPVIPAMLALSAALVLLGAGILLISTGAVLLATAFKIITDAGTAGISVLIALIDEILERVPVLAEGLALAMLEIADIILDALPVIIEQLGVILGHLIDTVIDLIPKIVELMIELIDAVIQVLDEKGPDIIQAGFDLLINLLKGIADNIEEVTNTVIDIFVKFLDSITERLGDIVAAGAELLAEFLRGIADNIGTVLSAATDVITSFITGIGDMAVDVVAAGVDTVLAFLEGVADNAIRLAQGAADIIIDFVNALADTINEKMPEIRDAGWELAKALINGMTFGLAGGVKDVADKAWDVGKSAVSTVGGWFGIGSPAVELGESFMNNIARGIDNKSMIPIDNAEDVAKLASERFQNSLSLVADSLGSMSEFNPTISPVLDLSSVERDASRIGDIVGGASLATPITSYNQANSIATSETAQDADVAQTAGVTEIKFEQNNYSPESLSTADIYRQTRNQITIAKEELNIL